MRTLLIIAFGSVLLLGCESKHKVAVTSALTTNAPVAVAGSGLPITHGDIIARIVGPHRPTPDTTIPSGPNTISNFWVTLEVTDVRDGFAAELRGRTIRLPTCEFDAALVGQTLPLRISHSPGRFHGSDYWLTCTSIGISSWVATPSATR